MSSAVESRGFTLLELVVALAILSILVTMATPVVQLQAQRQKESELRAALRDIRNAIDAYKRAADAGRIAKAADASGYPSRLEVLVEGVTDTRDPKGRLIFFCAGYHRIRLRLTQRLPLPRRGASAALKAHPPHPRKAMTFSTSIRCRPSARSTEVSTESGDRCSPVSKLSL